MLNTCAIIRIYLILTAVRPGIRNGKQKNIVPNNFFSYDVNNWSDSKCLCVGTKFFVTVWKRLFSVKSFSSWSREWLTLYPFAIILLIKP